MTWRGTRRPRQNDSRRIEITGRIFTRGVKSIEEIYRRYKIADHREAPIARFEDDESRFLE